MTRSTAGDDRENVAKGVALAALVIPAAMFLWAAMWQGGTFMIAILLFLPVAAALLYVKGANGRNSTLGAALVSLLVIVGNVLGFFAGILTSVVGSMASMLSVTWYSILLNADFWPVFLDNLPRFVGEASSQSFLVFLVSAAGAAFVFYMRFTASRARSAVTS